MNNEQRARAAVNARLGAIAKLANLAKRRFVKTLQSLSCFHFMAMFLFFNFGLLFLFIYLLYTPFFLLPFGYAIWLWLDKDTPHRSGRRFQFVRHLRIWKWMRDYFPVNFHKTADLDPKKNYIFSFHPHGIFVCGGFVNFCTEANNFEQLFPGITCHFLVLDGHFMFPLYRDYILAGGAGAVNPESVRYKLTHLGTGQAVWIAVGGAAEAFLSTPSTYMLKILCRKGFVKMALMTGASLVPVFSFGETGIFHQICMPQDSWLFRFQEAARRLLGFAPVMFRGRLPFFIMPFRRPINTIVGAPIDMPKILEPSEEEIDRWHQIYLNELRKLYMDNREKFGDGDKELEFC